MTRREWLQLSAASTLTGGLHSPLAFAQEPAKPKSPDEMIHAYLAAEAKRIDRAVHGRGEDESGVGGKRPRLKERVPRHARPLAAAGEDAAQGDRHRHARARRRRRSRSCTSRASRGCTSPATSTGRRRARRTRSCPAILYVCGHSGRGRDGNKTAFQDHGMWFATNGYVCLVVDTLQLGEIAGIHHGTYNLEPLVVARRGYTPGRRRVLERHPRHRLPRARGRTSTRRRSASPASPAAARRRSGSPPPTTA